jgi:predicted  nucleic acid-binding Zn-ribbon protein
MTKDKKNKEVKLTPEEKVEVLAATEDRIQKINERLTGIKEEKEKRAGQIEVRREEIESQIKKIDEKVKELAKKTDERVDKLLQEQEKLEDRRKKVKSGEYTHLAEKG